MAALPQVLCIPLGAGLQNCVTLPVPPFQPVQPPNNVLVIPVPQPPRPPSDNSLVQLQETVEGCETFVNGPPYDTSSCNVDTQLGQCSAIRQYEWYYDHQIDPFSGLPRKIGLPRHLILANTVTGDVLYDSDPLGTWADDCPNSQSIILLNPPPPPPPPPTGNGLSCHDGSAPQLAPCGPGRCYESGVGCCPCDPPLPYGPAGPLVDGSENSTESYWTAAPAPLGLPTPELMEDDPGARIAPEITPIGAPIAIPLPTSSIAVTACNSCAGDAAEIDEL
jgi:hypothetical protein